MPSRAYLPCGAFMRFAQANEAAKRDLTAAADLGLSGTGQVIEGTPLRRLVDLLVNP